jgi:TP53 regulating kinase-like protein
MGGMSQPQLIKKGAEAYLYLAEWQGRKAVLKKRLPKKYRLPALDERIRTYRTVHEPRLMHEARKAGVPTPTIFFVDVKNALIVMEHVDGKQLKQLLNEVSNNERKRLCRQVGELVGRLHKHGIVHGDLTTSNMIYARDGKIFFVDFGLGEKTKDVEAMGVDLHLMKRALQSTHYEFADECFRNLIEGYSKVLDAETVKNVLDKVEEIEKRGRYVSERRQRKA